MASFVFNIAAEKILDGTVDLDNDTLKIMLLQNTGNWTPDRDEDVIDDGLAGGAEPADDECTATNYARGTATVSSISRQDANDRGIVIFSDQTFTSLGGAANNTISGAILYRQVTDDTDHIPICYWDVADTATDGNNFTLTMDATDGNLRASTS